MKHSVLKQSVTVTRTMSALKIMKQMQSFMSQCLFWLSDSDSISEHLISAVLMSIMQTELSQTISSHAKLTSSFIVRSWKFKSEFMTVFNLQQCQEQQSTDCQQIMKVSEKFVDSAAHFIVNRDNILNWEWNRIAVMIKHEATQYLNIKQNMILMPETITAKDFNNEIQTWENEVIECLMLNKKQWYV